MFLGVDTGGTFTDFVLFDGSGLRFHKELSTPEDPSLAIEHGIRRLGLDAAVLHLIHGSTVATNAILEHKGVKTLFITNSNLEDLLMIGRQRREKLYSLTPEPREQWMKRCDAMGLSGRLDAEGDEIEAVDLHQLNGLAEVVAVGEYQAVAICQLFAFLNATHEQQIAKALPNDLFVSLSHQVLAEYREYERGATTFLNAYVGPLVQKYLQRLAQALRPKHLFVMHSAGGVMDAQAAGAQAVKLALSGPAGGLVAAETIGRQLDQVNLLTFDMGGTSTDVALIKGRAEKTTNSEIAGMPIALPMLDIHTIGAGGGSLAWIDEAGLPQVGPESAGASPGPVCYGQGGERAAVTDANLVLGRIPSDALLAGRMALDRDAAVAAFEAYGKSLGLNAEEAADAVIRIAEEHMAGALRLVSVERGHNPAEFALLCFGGAGGLHACSLAEKLGMQRVILPLASGAFSALGMLAGRQQSEFSKSRRIAVTDSAMDILQAMFIELEAEAAKGMQGLNLSFEHHVDLRYQGQGFHLTVPMQDDLDVMLDHFKTAHRSAYGHELDRDIEIMTARLTAFVERPELTLPLLAKSNGEAQVQGYATIHGVGEVPRFLRASFGSGSTLSGPALILEDTSTLWLPGGWQLHCSAHGHLMLERGCVS